MPHKDPERRKAYAREYNRKYFAKGTETHKRHVERAAINKADARERALEIITKWKAAGCSCCDEREIACMCAHHLDPMAKEFAIGDVLRMGISVAKIEKELAKCVCLCLNCHAKVHGGIVILRGRAAGSSAAS